MDYYLICVLTYINTVEILTVCDSLRNAQICMFNFEPVPEIIEMWIEEGVMNQYGHQEIAGTRRKFAL